MPASPLPFATIVLSNYPGHDEASRLDRPGVFRLDLGVGRDELARAVPAGADVVDASTLDRSMPHPVYGAQVWVAILDPSTPRPLDPSTPRPLAARPSTG